MDGATTRPTSGLGRSAFGLWTHKTPAAWKRRGFWEVDMGIARYVLCRPGSDLLSRVLRRSTIGAEEFNGRVRDGIGFRLLAIATRPAKHISGKRSWFLSKMTVVSVQW